MHRQRLRSQSDVFTVRAAAGADSPQLLNITSSQHAAAMAAGGWGSSANLTAGDYLQQAQQQQQQQQREQQQRDQRGSPHDQQQREQQGGRPELPPRRGSQPQMAVPPSYLSQLSGLQHPGLRGRSHPVGSAPPAATDLLANLQHLQHQGQFPPGMGLPGAGIPPSPFGIGRLDSFGAGGTPQLNAAAAAVAALTSGMQQGDFLQSFGSTEGLHMFGGGAGSLLSTPREGGNMFGSVGASPLPMSPNMWADKWADMILSSGAGTHSGP